MRIDFVLGWEKSAKKKLSASFKNKALGEAFEDYFLRSKRYSNCQLSNGASVFLERKEASEKVWICHLGKRAKNFSSDQVAQYLLEYQNLGVKKWSIVVGPANGFSEEDLKKISHDELWSFGAMTLPHELAAVVMAEQIYRAHSIIKGEPYHLGH